VSKEKIVEVKPEKIRTEAIGTEAIGTVSYWTVNAGDSSGDKKLNITPFNPPFATPTPFTIVFQSRQTDNVDHDWPDQFAVQVIQTTQNSILVRIRRLDSPGSGWGQQLGLNLIVRE
jgi:hypothetical protein